MSESTYYDEENRRSHEYSRNHIENVEIRSKKPENPGIVFCDTCKIYILKKVLFVFFYRRTFVHSYIH